jgi:hypothetical protein
MNYKALDKSLKTRYHFSLPRLYMSYLTSKERYNTLHIQVELLHCVHFGSQILKVWFLLTETLEQRSKFPKFRIKYNLRCHEHFPIHIIIVTQRNSRLNKCVLTNSVAHYYSGHSLKTAGEPQPPQFVSELHCNLVNHKN